VSGRLSGQQLLAGAGEYLFVEERLQPAKEGARMTTASEGEQHLARSRHAILSEQPKQLQIVITETIPPGRRGREAAEAVRSSAAPARQGSSTA
jgi:hypothetical protein